MILYVGNTASSHDMEIVDADWRWLNMIYKPKIIIIMLFVDMLYLDGSESAEGFSSQYVYCGSLYRVIGCVYSNKNPWMLEYPFSANPLSHLACCSNQDKAYQKHVAQANTTHEHISFLVTQYTDTLNYSHQ